MTLKKYKEIQDKYEEYKKMEEAIKGLKKSSNGMLYFFTSDQTVNGFLSLYSNPDVYEHLLEYLQKRKDQISKEFSEM